MHNLKPLPKSLSRTFDTVDEALRRNPDYSSAYYAAKDMHILQVNGILNIDQTVQALKVTTECMLVTEKTVLGTLSDWHFDATKVSYRLINDIVSLNPDTPETTSIEKDDSNAVDKGQKYFQNVALCWNMIEEKINEIDKNESIQYKSKIFSFIAKMTGEILQHNKTQPWPSYEGNNLRISSSIGLHTPAVAVLPKEPENAVAALFYTDAKQIFSQYAGENSCENYVQTCYGTDGLYAKHYLDFLDLRQRYPSQNHVFF